MSLCNSKSPTHFRIQQSQPLLFLRLTIFVFVPFPFADSIFIQYHHFQPNDSTITYQGDAFAFNTNIELTNALDTDSFTRIGRASYTNPVHLWDSKTGNMTDFYTLFSFNITPTNNSNTYFGDGLTFFLSPYNASIPNNTLGGLLGLFNSTVLGHTNNQILAVEFDTKQDSWDPCPYHIGVDVNSITSVAYTQLDDRLANGTAADAWVIYDSNTKTLSVWLSYDGGQTFSKLFYDIDLRNVLPEWVSVGFSASLPTGSTERHTITSWLFNSSYGILGDSPSNSASGSGPSPSNSASGDSPSTITGHKINPAVVAVPVAIGSLIFGVGFFFIIRNGRIRKTKKDNNTPRGSHERAAQDRNTITQSGGSIGSTNVGAGVSMWGNGPQFFGNTIQHIYNGHPPVPKEKCIPEESEA